MKKFLGVFLSLVLLVYSLTFFGKASFLTFAQETSPTPTTTDQPTPAPSPTDLSTPTDSPTTTPTDVSTPQDTSTPVVTTTPTPDTATPSPVATTTPIATTTPQSTTTVAPSVTPAATPTVSTDKQNYIYTDTVIVTGKDFSPDSSYTLEISSADAPALDFKTNVTTDTNGTFVYAYQLDTYRADYLVQVKDASGNVLASTTFKDPNPAANLDQCQNGSPFALSNFSLECGHGASQDWANGDVNGSNSGYREGDGLPYRASVTGLTNGTWTIRLQYDFTKGGIYAIDRLTKYNLTQASDPCANPGGAGCSEGVGQNLITIPSEVVTPDSTHPALPSSGKLFTWTGNPPGAPGHLNDITDSGKFTLWAGSGSIVVGTAGQNWTGSQATSFTDGNVLQSGLSTGDSTREFAFKVTTSGCPGGGCQLELGWTGHISSSHSASDGGWGDGMGAGSITGAPFHMRVLGVDNAQGTSGGNQDRSVQLSAIVQTLTVNKVCSPSDNTGKFNLQIDSVTKATDAACGGTTGAVSVSSGTHTVSEAAGTGTNLSNYSASISCDNGANGSGTSLSGVNVGVGASVICTITNTLQQAHLTLVKTVTNDNGGTAVATDWTLAASGPTPISGTSGSGSVTGAAVNSGTYTLLENSGPSDYSASTYSCVVNGAGAVINNSVTLAPGDNATCTINNNDNAPALHLRKVVINDNGGSAANTDWTLTATGTGGSPTNLSGATPVDSGAGFKADTYTLAESGPSGYDASSWVCVGGTQNGSNITVALGQSATCTITNNDQAAHLIIIKNVVNDNGGTKNAGDFSGSISGVTVSGGQTWTGTVSPGVNKTLTTIGSYTISETLDPDYETTYSSGCIGTISLGQTKTCTVTNNDKAAHLIVIKHVVNDNGGGKVAADFTTTISGVTTASPTAAGVESPGVDNVLTSVGAYTVDEGTHTGYDKTLSTDCSGTIGLDQTKTCTITNDDIQPQLTVIKHVANNHGGNNIAGDFTMTVTGTSPSPASFDGNESGTLVHLNTGSYSVTESGPLGYTESDSTDCSGTISIGESKTCTITNTDQPAHIVLTKVVNNNHGGQAGSNDFGISIDGGTVLSASTTDVNSNTAHALNETGLSGYQFVSLTGDAKCPSVLGGSVTLNEGETVRCTITNQDIAPQLTVIKHVVNDDGGVAKASDFTMNVTGTNVQPTSSFAGAEAPGTTVTLNQGSYSVDENSFSGYTKFLGTNCSGTINVGETKTCTVTNDDQPAHLIVIKRVINNNGGTAVAGDFSMEINLTTVLDGTSAFPGSETGITRQVNPGSYSVTEDGLVGYAPGFSEDCSGTIALGQTKTCTVTNDDIAPKLTLVKVVVNDDGVGQKQFQISHYL
ncbi:hypothetical protein HY045_02005 [Candidatus Woesebacteria bacterium]|nr:hypothetical protein [Candidatus Woesebacteria bacterium]